MLFEELQTGQLFRFAHRPQFAWEYRGNSWYGEPGGYDDGPRHLYSNPAVFPQNARWWEYVNGGPVRITLRPGQSLSWETGGPTDEGWHSEGYTWTHEVDRVTCEGWHDGCDCDGRLSGSNTTECVLGDLDAENEPYGLDDCDGIYYPAWKRVSASRRDYAAEAAGY